MHTCCSFAFPECPSSCPSLDIRLYTSVPYGATTLSCGRRKVICICLDLRAGYLNLRFRLRNPRVLFDLAGVLPMCVFHFGSCETCTPENSVLCAVVIGTAWSVNSRMIGFFFGLTLAHLSVLKLISPSYSHSSRSADQIAVGYDIL